MSWEWVKDKILPTILLAMIFAGFKVYNQNQAMMTSNAALVESNRELKGEVKALREKLEQLRLDWSQDHVWVDLLWNQPRKQK